MAALHWSRIRTASLMAGTACLIIATLSACSLLPNEEAAIPPPLVKPAEQKFDVVEVKKGELSTYFQGVASIVSKDTRDVFFKQNGARVAEVLVSQGDEVKKGQLLVRLDNEDLALRLDLQRITYQKTELDLQRIIKSGDEEEIQMKKLDLQAAKLQLDSLESQMERTQLLSPINGIVIYGADLVAGQNVNAYETLFRIADPSKAQIVYTSNNPAELARLEVNMPAEVTINKKTYPGVLVQTPSSAPITGNQEQDNYNMNTLIVSVDGVKGRIGELVTVKVFLDKKDNVLIVPKVAVRTYLDRKYVQVLVGERRKEVDVELGLATTTEIEIVHGVSEGDKIVLNN